ncbi:MAG TPA: D-alanyl-D-alanine carboxypeptidase/D-alanyl-D-alanine-endopeptidase [Microlunatus sp.]|nr:D-alanyl-D-alanine carboxypeptidase/D-alanyl-D-alanine-endopeptidase [Microlunatus sp.]
MSRSLPHLGAMLTGRGFPRRTIAPRSLVLALSAGVVITGAGLVAPPPQLPPAAATVADKALATKLAGVLKDSRVTKGRTSAVVLDAATGSELFQRSGSRATVPASNTKIVTAAAALHTLGPGHRFQTQVIRRAKITGSTLDGRLYLKGYGDPTARVSDYAALAKRVRAAGIRTVTGKLIVDATYFDSVRYNPTWRTGYADDYYAAEISALTVAPNADYDSGTVIISYRAGSAGKKAKITTSPAAAASYLSLKNLTTTGKKGTATSFSASRAQGSKTITLRGRVAKGRSGSRLITVHRPDLYAAAVFRAELKKTGVTVRGGTASLATPAARRVVLATDYSMTLSQLLVPFMKLSNNMHAEALTKAMGAKRSGAPGSWSNGLAATRAYLTRIRVPMGGVSLSDGSGLTRANSLTPRALGTLLVKVQQEKWFPAFKASLPVAGNSRRMVGGTLRHRMNGTRAADHAWAKTGTLTGVTALSGYVQGRDGRLYAFSMLSQYSGSTPRPVEDKLVVALAGWRR